MTQPPNDIASLIGRVEAAGGPDRGLDAEIAVAFSDDPGAWVVNPSPHSIFSAAPGWFRTSDDKSHNAPEFTAGLDAVIALARHQGFYINSTPMFHDDGEWIDFVSHALRPRWDEWNPFGDWFDRGEGRHADQVLSALLALLRAVEARALLPQVSLARGEGLEEQGLSSSVDESAASVAAQPDWSTAQHSSGKEGR